MAKRIIIGLTGATGQIFGIKALEILTDERDVEAHLVMSDAAKTTIEHESDFPLSKVTDLADQTHSVHEIGAPVASGSFETMGMLIAPCSMNTLSKIGHGISDNLITRAADVSLKERRQLVLMPREKPLNKIHLKNMLEATEAGAIISPPFLSFYQGHQSIDPLITRTMTRTLNLFNLDFDYEEWDGIADS